jgi:dolichol-phosphate mannosyltransferase
MERVNKSRPRVTVVIPTKNEEWTIEWIVNGAKPYADEVLVVDGHSKDRTRQRAKQAGARVILDHGKGKGDGLRTAIAKAKGDILVFIDADGSTKPTDIPKLLKPILAGEADHVHGSRTKGGSDELSGDWNKFLRILGSQIITQGINWRFGVYLTDSQYGFRAIRTDVARSLKLKENIMTIEQEIVIKSLRMGYRLIEVPIHEYKRKFGRSTIYLRRVAWRFVWSWMKYLIWG